MRNLDEDVKIEQKRIVRKLKVELSKINNRIKAIDNLIISSSVAPNSYNILALLDLSKDALLNERISLLKQIRSIQPSLFDRLGQFIEKNR